uniref:Reverse transcriptase domain-containing protein n=1 Tax=Tanacetum cinerariifolium TaxID=118510 RepID=A0A6L2MVA7_TANCI|nr:reverse transcriptase domain-containing protein [Tanacetum cinerariifolium]
MNAMANTTPIVTTITKIATKEKTPNGAEAASRVNILDFCEEHYEDILSVMDKIRHDKRKEVHTRLDFGENSRKSQRMREESQNSSAKTLSARYCNPSKRPQIRDRLRNNDENVFGRLGHRRQSTFKRLSDTYSPSTPKSGPDREYSRDGSYSRGHPHKRDSSLSRDRPRSRDRSYGIKESCSNTYPSYRTGDKHSEGGHWKSKSKKCKPTDEEDLAAHWSCEEVDPFTPRIRNFKRTTRIWFDELPPESIDGYKDLKAAFLTYFMQQKKYVKDPVEIYNIKQKDGETIEDFIERFKVEIGRVKGAPECMNQPRNGRGSNKFTSLTRTPKEIFTAESGKFKPPPPIVRSPSPYNGIIRRPEIREIQTVPYTAHGMLKFLVNGGIVTIRSTILTPTECTTIAATPKDHAKKAEARHENFKVAIHLDFPDQEITIGGTEYHDRLPSTDLIYEKDTPLSDKKTKAGPGARQGNPSKDLNKACPHDCYPLSEVDWKVESLCGYPFKCFLDAYKGYHQIQMAKQDEEKTAFHTSHGVYCYTKMPFGLKNAGATYQRLVDKAFDKQIGRNLEIYVDDLVIKSHIETELLRDIEETLCTLRRINMKLNPKKYTFRVAEGMFLGYTINPEGIKPCPKKTKAVLQLPSRQRSPESQREAG